MQPYLGEVLELEALALRPVEVVAHAEEDGEDGGEGARAPQRLHPHLEVHQRLANLLLHQFEFDLEVKQGLDLRYLRRTNWKGEILWVNGLL